MCRLPGDRNRSLVNLLLLASLRPARRRIDNPLRLMLTPPTRPNTKYSHTVVSHNIFGVCIIRGAGGGVNIRGSGLIPLAVIGIHGLHSSIG